MRICCISQSVLADDPRVRRQIDALRDAGHEVIGVGFEGGLGTHLDGESALIAPARRSLAAKASMTLGSVAGRVARRDALAVFGSFPASQELAEAARSVEADLYLANDWRALPSAAAAAAAHRARYAFDSHEWGVAEFAERRLWRATFPWLIEAIEGSLLPGAAFVTAVSPGIGRLLADAYHLPEPPTVIRNMPAYSETPFRATGETVSVLYHGVFMPGRGLEELVRSVPKWPQGYRLGLRGFGDPAYERSLVALAEQVGAADRLDLLGRAPMPELVRLAATADVGIHPLQAVNPNAVHALPNKLFEYAMAGLAVCVSDVPDMAELVHRYQLGWLLGSVDAGAIAELVASMTPPAIDAAKRHALAAAKELCWETERQKLVNLVERSI